MIERMTKEVSSADHDVCRDVLLFAFPDGMAIYVPGRRLREIGQNSQLEQGRRIVGLLATFELVEGRWELARLAEKR